jgi:hypothetical protein
VDRSKFEERYYEFLDSDPDNKKVYRREKDCLIFESEQLIPQKVDTRPALLMVFGNPAPQSVAEGMFFAFEGNRKPHRFWKHIAEPSGILDIKVNSKWSLERCNERRKRCILQLDYATPYRIGLCVFVSLPSGASPKKASTRKWAGVNGINRLLGKEAMKNLLPYEQERVLKVARKFLGPGGVVITFQKDAWEGLRGDNDPLYNIERARECGLKGRLKEMRSISLYGLPPTRLVGPCRNALCQVLNTFLGVRKAPR